MHYARSYLDSCNQGRERRARVGRLEKMSKPSRDRIKRGLNVARKSHAWDIAARCHVGSGRFTRASISTLEKIMARAARRSRLAKCVTRSWIKHLEGTSYARNVIATRQWQWQIIAMVGTRRCFCKSRWRSIRERIAEMKKIITD